MNVEFKDYNDFVKKYGPPLSEKPVTIATIIVGMYFEGIGVLLYRKLVNIELVQHLFILPVKITWEKMKPMVEVARKQLDQPTIFVSFEYLYNELKEREQQRVKI